jgi:drug/metabolite transporter (DMT)-like permease
MSASSDSARRRATLAGFGAIALWASLASLTAFTGTIPPFQLNAMTFFAGALAGAAGWIVRPQAARAVIQPLRVWVVGLGGLFGYHALYFAALRLAPPAEAGLVNYLWPLLIVLGSALLPGERLRPIHVLGAISGFAGVAVLAFGKSGGLAFDPDHLAGYICAFAAAFVWAAYSLLSRRLGEVPTDAVTGFCLATAVLSVMCHLAFETTVIPTSCVEWTAIIALGLGPVGAAFYLWDVGVKRGDIRLLGFASYATPVLSTFLLILFGFADATPVLLVSCALIVGGALLATLAPQARSPAQAGR